MGEWRGESLGWGNVAVGGKQPLSQSLQGFPVNDARAVLIVLGLLHPHGGKGP
jgi:hypothetical protein